MTSDAASSRSMRMLYARLQLAVPEARTFLVAPPRATVDAFPVALDLARLVAETGSPVHVIRFATTPAPDKESAPLPSGAEQSAGSLESRVVSEVGLGSSERLRAAVGEFRDITLIAGSALLESPATVLAATIVDGVVVVARRGKTTRSELAQVRRDVESAGGRIAGSVLLR